MSADGEIEVSVKAEGADDAADELAEGAEATGGGGGDGGGFASSVRGGIIGGILSQVAGPLLNTLDPILKVLQAFLAPVAILLLRLLQPFLRFALKRLPEWTAFFQNLSDKIERLDLLETLALILGPSGLAGTALRLLSTLDDAGTTLDDIVKKVNSLPRRIWSFVRRLPARIGSRVASELPNVSSSQGADLGRIAAAGATGGPTGAARTAINISGGLEPFIEKLETETGVDIP